MNPTEKIIFFRELEHYTRDEIIFQLGLSQSDTSIDVIRDLSCRQILKLKKNSDDSDDIEEYSEGKNSYVFDYVGVIEYYQRIIFCYPKYIKNTPQVEDAKLIIAALEKYNSQQFILRISTENDTVWEYNRIGAELALLRDYFENGIYCNSKNVLELHGNAEIDWDTTVNETLPIIQNGEPYYVDYYTLQTVADADDFITKLHKCLLTECSKHFLITGLDTLLSVDTPILSENDLENIADKEYIKKRILQEIQNQFITKKQLTLRLMYALVCLSEQSLDNSDFSLFGTNNFNLVWENACADVLGSMHKTELKSLPLSIAEQWKKYSDNTLLDIINKPKWSIVGIDNPIFSKKTLKPDYLSITRHNGQTFFVILDAKYYDMLITDRYINGVPGVADIDKQQLYHLAYQKFLENHGINSVINAFVFPSENNSVQVIGTVEMEFLSLLKLEPVKLISFSAKRMLTLYSNGDRLQLNNVLPELFISKNDS